MTTISRTPDPGQEPSIKNWQEIDTSTVDGLRALDRLIAARLQRPDVNSTHLPAFTANNNHAMELISGYAFVHHHAPGGLAAFPTYTEQVALWSEPGRKVIGLGVENYFSLAACLAWLQATDDASAGSTPTSGGDEVQS